MFRNVTIFFLLDSEQQELLQAAKVIQNAYRQFKVGNVEYENINLI